MVRIPPGFLVYNVYGRRGLVVPTARGLGTARSWDGTQGFGDGIEFC